MSTEEQQRRRDSEMLVRMIQGELSDAEFSEVDRRLQEEPAFRTFYLAFMQDHVALASLTPKDWESPTAAELGDPRTWKALIRMEEDAPRAALPSVSDTELSLSENTANTFSPRWQRLRWIISVCSAAALILLVIALNIIPPPVATLLDTHQARWQGGAETRAIGARLRARTYRLERGYARILMDRGAEFLVEGPASFKLDDINRVILKRGRGTAHVSPMALGFTVQTRWADVVDHGTDFGVIVAADGSAQAHVLEGAVSLQAKQDDGKAGSLRLNSDEAARITSKQLASIDSRVDNFAYEIPTDFEAAVRRSQPYLYLKVLDRNNNPRRLVNVVGPQVNTQLLGGVEQTVGPDLGQGRKGRALMFNHASQTLVVSEIGPEWDRTVPRRPFALAAWIRPQTAAAQHVMSVVTFNPQIQNTYLRTVRINTEGCLEWVNYLPHRQSFTEALARTEQPVQPGQWYFVAIMNSKIYTRCMLVNGRRYSPNDRVGSTGTIQALSIGAVPSDYTDLVNLPPFQGAVGDIVYYNRPIDFGELQQIYQASR